MAMEKVLHSQMPFTTGGQTISDRLTAAKHSIAGSQLGKAVCKATTEEMSGPKKKHLDYLLHCTHEPNVSIPQMANFLVERTQNSNWCVVFKSLITLHNLMCYGNERFTQYLASSNVNLNLGNFLDKTSVMGYDMSTHIRRYAKYIGEKIFTYRLCAFDFCKVKRGKEDGLLRTMPTDKLIKTLPTLQGQIDALLEFQVSTAELSNGVINSGFILLFRDLIRLFACYNDGIINLLEKYFDMNKKQCKDALDLYKKFLLRMDKVAEFLKVAESVGIDRGEIPDLAKAPNSLLEALEQHLAALEGTKSTGSRVTSPVNSGSSVAATQRVISSFSGLVDNQLNLFEDIDEATKRKYLEEEQQRLALLKEQRLKEMDPSARVTISANNPFLPSPVSTATAVEHRRSNVDLLDSLLDEPSNINSSQSHGVQGDLFNLPSTNPFAFSDSSSAYSNNSATMLPSRHDGLLMSSGGVAPGPKNNFVPDNAFDQAFNSSVFGENTGAELFGLHSASVPDPPSRGPSPAVGPGMSTNPFMSEPTVTHSAFNNTSAAWGMSVTTPQNSPALRTTYGMDSNNDDQDSSPELPNPSEIGNPFASFQQNAAAFGATAFEAPAVHIGFEEAERPGQVVSTPQYDFMSDVGSQFLPSPAAGGGVNVEPRAASEALPINVYHQTPFSGFDSSYTASPQLPHRAAFNPEMDPFAPTRSPNMAAPTGVNQHPPASGAKLFGNDLDSSLMNLAQNLTIDKKQQNVQKGPVQWGPRPMQPANPGAVMWGTPMPQQSPYGMQPGGMQPGAWNPGAVGNPSMQSGFPLRVAAAPYRPIMNPTATQFIPGTQPTQQSSMDPFGAL